MSLQNKLVDFLRALWLLTYENEGDRMLEACSRRGTPAAFFHDTMKQKLSTACSCCRETSSLTPQICCLGLSSDRGTQKDGAWGRAVARKGWFNPI